MKAEELQAKQQAEGLRAGIDVAKSREQMRLQEAQARQTAQPNEGTEQ